MINFQVPLQYNDAYVGGRVRARKGERREERERERELFSFLLK
jgi:hypothetical protein